MKFSRGDIAVPNRMPGTALEYVLEASPTEYTVRRLDNVPEEFNHIYRYSSEFFELTSDLVTSAFREEYNE